MLVAGCAGPPEISTSATHEAAPPEKAFVKPPPGGPAIVAVVQHGTGQDIMLATHARRPGQNRIHVRLKQHADGALAPLGAIAEMRAALPGIAMRKSPYYVQNRYGPFGYGVGRSGPDLCLYAWQGI